MVYSFSLHHMIRPILENVVLMRENVFFSLPDSTEFDENFRGLQIKTHYIKYFEVGVNKLPIIFLLFPPFYYIAYSPSVLFLQICVHFKI